MQTLGVRSEAGGDGRSLDLTISPESGGQVLTVLSAASSVRSHLDFFTWLQTEVRAFLPHQTLFAAWGDFSTGDIHYDVASTVPGLSTRNVARLEGLKQAVCQLFNKVNESGQPWVKLRDPLATAPGFSWGELHPPVVRELTRTDSAPPLVVYAMHDERSGCDAIYIFTINEAQEDIDLALLHLIMPHLDAALRRVPCLDLPHSGTEAGESGHLDDLSGREREVLHWVSQGKSNKKIGAILGISHNTVKNHLKRIFNKLGVTSRSQAVGVFVQGKMTS
jgi:transcriptional regulator EpsA